MKKALFVALLAMSATMFSACSAALLSGKSGTSYGSVSGSPQQAGDQAISAAVEKGLASDPVTEGSEIKIETVDAIVILKGDVASVRISRRAGEIAGQVDKVRAVRNHLWVSSSKESRPEH
jgi:hypothetical protein